MNRVGHNLVVWRHRLQLSSTHVASSIPVSLSYYSRLEAGHYDVPLKILERIADIFGQPMSALLADFEPANIGEAVHFHRTQQRMTIAKLAKRSGLSRYLLTRLEDPAPQSGPHDINMSQLASIADALNIPLSVLIISDNHSPEDEDDIIFFNKYKQLSGPDKRKMQGFIKILSQIE